MKTDAALPWAAVVGARPRTIDRSVIALAVLLFVVPELMPSKLLATEIVIWALLATAFNLLLGHAGLLSFGHAALFGTGAYTCGLLAMRLGLDIVSGLLGGALAAALVAAVVGFLSIQRVGVYFVMLTLAFNEMIFFTAYEWKSVTGGDDGLMGVPRAALGAGGLRLTLESTGAYYDFVAVVFLLSFVAMRRIVQSPFGGVLRAIRENEARARAVGFAVKPYKVLAFVISGFFSGLAGGLYAMFIGMVPLNVVEFSTSGKAVIMTLLGGSGSLYGPIIGAAVVTILSDVLSNLWARWSLLLGLLFVGVVLFFRGGIWQVLESVTRRRRVETDAAA